MGVKVGFQPIIFLQDLGSGIDEYPPRQPVDDESIACADSSCGFRYANQQRDAQLSRQDGSVRGLTSLLHDQAANRPAIQASSYRGQELGRHKHTPVRKDRSLRGLIPRESIQQPVSDILQICRSFPQIGIFHSQERRRQLLDRFLHGCFDIGIPVETSGEISSRNEGARRRPTCAWKIPAEWSPRDC